MNPIRITALSLLAALALPATAGLKLEGDQTAKAVQRPADAPTRAPSRTSTQDAVMTWQLKAGDNVKDALGQWAIAAGWEGVSWEVPEIEARGGMTIQGTFPEAVEALIRALNEGGAALHPMAYENLVLRIVAGRR